MKSTLRPALILFTGLTFVCCGFYPLVVTGLGQILFPHQSGGSLITKNDQTIGSSLIGQTFSSSQYFWGRLSATGPMAYNAAASSGSNRGPLNPALIEAVKERIAILKAADPQNTKPVPVDLVTSSGSGLDPEISLAAAYYQAERIAQARHLSLNEVHALIEKYKKDRFFGFLGEPRVNVLELNLALDKVN